jgi:hypothetical protein
MTGKPLTARLNFAPGGLPEGVVAHSLSNCHVTGNFSGGNARFARNVTGPKSNG